MSFKCAICGKGPTAGKTVSHSHKATNRIFKPNLQRHRIVVEGNVRRKYVCSRCLKGGKVRKAG